jgi:DNA-binding transcriptional ArsR family regulator
MLPVDLDAVDDVLTALADPTRRRLLDRLAGHGETTATVLGAQLPVSRQAVVQHLGVLEQVDLVSSRRVGRERRYRVRPERLTETARWLSQVAQAWDARLDAIRLLAEAAGDQARSQVRPP